MFLNIIFPDTFVYIKTIKPLLPQPTVAFSPFSMLSYIHFSYPAPSNNFLQALDMLINFRLVPKYHLQRCTLSSEPNNINSCPKLM